MSPSLAAEQTKTRLARAARDLLLQHGLSGLSMRKVASECRVSATAIYRHYSDKDALVARAVVEGFRTFGHYLLDALEEKTAAKRFRTLGQRYFDFAREHPQDYRLIFMTDCAQLGLTQLDEASKKEVSGTFMLLQDRVAECIAAGVFRAGDPRAIAASVWSSTHGLSSLIVNGQLGISAQETDALIQLHLDHIERGLAS